MPLPPERRRLRARLASLTRSRDPHDPELVELRHELGYWRLSDAIRAEVAAAPALSPEQRNRLRLLLSTATIPDPDNDSGPERGAKR